MAGLAKLPPAFIKDGTVTAGNASGRNDGAAFVLMMTKEKAEQLGYKPWAKWLAGGDHGVDPTIMGIAPAYAVPKALKMAGLKMSQMVVMECNEAFAVQNLAAEFVQNGVCQDGVDHPAAAFQFGASGRDLFHHTVADDEFGVVALGQQARDIAQVGGTTAPRFDHGCQPLQGVAGVHRR